MIEHKSILKNEIVSYLCDQIEENERDCNDKLYFADLTFGGGGHSFAIKSECPQAIIKAIDKDPDIIEKSKIFFSKHNINYIELVHSDYNQFVEILNSRWLDVINHGGFNGILMDLGISSYQIDNQERGFSFRFDAPLDMRMNYLENGLTAEDIVNQYSEEKLAEILFLYGGERFSKRIADNIVKFRKEKPITTTQQLENIIFHSYPRKLRYNKTHPATKSFQAIRIVVNDELNSVENSLEHICYSLKKNGVITILTFHSLEDRIVKNIFKKLAMTKSFHLLEKKVVKPSENEIKENSRSRSAKLRVLKRIFV